MVALLKMKRRPRGRRRQRGQTVVEWLMLMALCFIIGYFVVTRPIALGTRLMLVTLRSSLVNMIANGSVRPGGLAAFGDGDHPSSESHFKAMHF